MTSEYQFTLYSPSDLALMEEELSEFESHFHYPLEPGVTFRIDHGERYAAFFEAIGKPSFLVMTSGDEIAGMMALVDKQILWQGKEISALYLADLKIHPSHRGKELSLEMYRQLKRELEEDVARQRWDLIYFATMEGERGDVMDSASPAGLIHLFQPLAKLHIYFEPPRRLAGIFGGEGAEGPLKYRRFEEPFQLDGRTLWLTQPSKSDDYLVDLSGRKDLITSEKDQKLNFVHLAMSKTLGHEYLTFVAQAGKRALDNFETCCFCLDDRREDLINFLHRRGISTESRASVYGFFPGEDIGPVDLVQMGTFEI